MSMILDYLQRQKMKWRSLCKGELKSNFTMTDLGEMKKILGIQVIWDRKASTLKIVQSAYIDKILAHFNMAKANR